MERGNTPHLNCKRTGDPAHPAGLIPNYLNTGRNHGCAGWYSTSLRKSNRCDNRKAFEKNIMIPLLTPGGFGKL